MITLKELRRLVNYEPETGVFTWALDRSNKCRKGSVAGGVDSQLGYHQLVLNGKKYRGHRLAWFYVYGTWPTGEVDHINHKRSDNRIQNLRVVTRAENKQNATKQKNNTSGHTGVYWFARDEKWMARITHHSKTHHLGYYDTLDEAVAARKQAELRFSFHPNHGAD